MRTVAPLQTQNISKGGRSTSEFGENYSELPGGSPKCSNCCNTLSNFGNLAYYLKANEFVDHERMLRHEYLDAEFGADTAKNEFNFVKMFT